MIFVYEIMLFTYQSAFLFIVLFFFNLSILN